MTTPQGNAVLVDALGSALKRGGNALESVPGLIDRVLTEGAWRQFVTQRGEPVEHETFIDFVTTPPLAGLGANVDLIERIINPYPETLRRFRAAIKGKRGPKSFRNNVTETPSTSATGNSRAYTLDRLSRDAPELHAEVVAGRLSAHAAMVKAGLRPSTFTVRADPQSIAATLRRRLTPDQLAELAQLLMGADAE